MEAISIKYIKSNKDNLQDKTLFVDLLKTLDIEQSKTYKILGCLDVTVETPLSSEIFKQAENKFAYYFETFNTDCDKKINDYNNLKKICLELEMYRFKERLKCKYKNQNLKDDLEEETMYCEFCNGLFNTSDHSEEKYMFYNQMDKNNQKASDILFNEGPDKAVEFMFKHPDTGQTMDYATMRYFYG